MKSASWSGDTRCAPSTPASGAPPYSFARTPGTRSRRRSPRSTALSSSSSPALRPPAAPARRRERGSRSPRAWCGGSGSCATSPRSTACSSPTRASSGSRGGRGRRRAVKFDAATNGSHPSPVPRPLSPIHVVGRGVDEGDPLGIDPELARRWLVSFLKDEVVVRRGFKKGIVGLSGGVDSSLTAFLAAEALGREDVIGLRMPYRSSSPESMEHAQLVIDKLGIEPVTVDISAAVDGYFAQVGDDDPHRKGNVIARERMIVLFDLSAKYRALPLGTGNKSERLLGYFTWHADDSPPVNPLGDLFKTQVWALARHVGVPEVIVTKPATADLIHGQTDEGDFGISYPKADRILYYLIRGMRPDEIVARGFTSAEVELVRGRLDSTHWKRRLPTVAVMSQTAIGEFYLRPVDY